MIHFCTVDHDRTLDQRIGVDVTTSIAEALAESGALDGLNPTEAADAIGIGALMLGPLVLARVFGKPGPEAGKPRTIALSEAFPGLADMEGKIGAFGLSLRLPTWPDSDAAQLWPRCVPVILPTEGGARVMRAAFAVAELLAASLIDAPSDDGGR